MDESQVLMDIKERLVRLETKIDTMAETRETAATAKQVANEALQSGKSAHHRIDSIEDGQKWLWRTVIGGIIVGAITLFWKGYGG